MTPTNVLFILTDDQGYGDLSCMGSDVIRTPHIDALAQSGVRCTQWYSGSSVCSPSRASLLTGRFPGNAGVRSILSGHRTASGLSREVPTLACMLSDAGYATFLSGKWHLGARRACWPDAHGFQHWFGFLAGCVDYFSHIYYWEMNRNGNNPTHDLWENGREQWLEGRYLTELISERAISSIQDAHAKSRPFFGYIAYNAPHYPMHAPERYRQRFAHLSWDRQLMAAMLAAVDDGVGAICSELERMGLRENTLIIFTSDNGPSRESRNWLDGSLDPYYGGSTGGLKGHKFSLFDGGIRVPGIVSYPRALSANVVSDAVVGSFDATPTALAACGISAAGREFDGRDFMPYLSGAQAPARDLFWELGGQTAIRRDRWKLVINGQKVEGETATDTLFLSDMMLDPSEHMNIARDHPTLTEELRASACEWIDGIEIRWVAQFNSGKDHGITAALRPQE